MDKPTLSDKEFIKEIRKIKLNKDTKILSGIKVKKLSRHSNRLSDGDYYIQYKLRYLKTGDYQFKVLYKKYKELMLKKIN